MKENQRRDIVKSNALVEACYRPKSLNQMRLLLAALTHVSAKQELTHETEFTVTAGALSDMTGANLQASYRALARAADDLMEMIVTIDVLPNGKSGRPYKRRINVVSACDYIKDNGCVVLNFTSHIIPYISELSSHFTAYKTQIMMNLKSAYGIRLYELCLQWIPFGPEREIEVETFRRIFQVGGKLKHVYDLKRKVVFPAIQDVNEHTDLNIRFGQVKRGRVITHFQFVITKKIVIQEEPLKRSKTPVAADPNDWREQTLAKAIKAARIKRKRKSIK